MNNGLSCATCSWPPMGMVATVLLLSGCAPDPLTLVTTSAEASAIAVEQCGNEFHLGQPARVSNDGDGWFIAWNTGFTATVESDSGALLACFPGAPD